MGIRIRCLILLGLVSGLTACSRPGQAADEDINMTFVSLGPRANAVIAEPPQTDSRRRRIALLVAHPEHANTFGYFLGPAFARLGYRTMLLNYYGREESYEEFLDPIAAAIRYLKSQPGIEKVVLAAHSSGGAEFSFYQDVAENGSQACQGPQRVYPCKNPQWGDLPPADGIMLLDIHIGGPIRMMSLDPAVDNAHPQLRNPDLDMFDPRNGFHPATGAGDYSREFVDKFLAAQHARSEALIDSALARLEKIDQGEGLFADDEPFVVAGGSVRRNGAWLPLANRKLLSKTRAPRLLLKADGSQSVQIVPSLVGGVADASDLGRLYATANNDTVRRYLSFYSVRTTPGYDVTEDDVKGMTWRSSANSAPGNVEGVTVPTLVLAGSCSHQLVLNEITFEHSAATDKQFAAVEGANHTFQPCDPEYGDTSGRAFNFADAWLTAEGRF